MVSAEKEGMNCETMFRYGLKLWSTNLNYLEAAKGLCREGICNYIELFVVPGSYDKCIGSWRRIQTDYIIHAPHSGVGLNLAKKENKEQNRKLMSEAQKFADELNSNWIIVHPGIDGDIEETIRQLLDINDYRILIENKPYYAFDTGLICNGTTPRDIEHILASAHVGFCLDIGHAIYSANVHKKDWMAFLLGFLKLNPKMFHLSDGDVGSNCDNHEHIGKGNFDFKSISSFLPHGAIITIETVKASSINLDDYIADVKALEKYDSKETGSRLC